MRVNSEPIDDAEAIDTWPSIRPTPTAFALLSLGMVTDAIDRLPGMAGHIGLAPLHDLKAALLDLGHGGRPALLEPTAGVGKGRDSTARRFVKNYAILFVGLLEKSGWTATTDACPEVARLLAATGHTNRKSGNKPPQPISAKTVEGWWSESRRANFKTKDPRAAAFLDRNLTRILSLHGGAMSKDQALAYVTSSINHSLLRSKT